MFDRHIKIKHETVMSETSSFDISSLVSCKLNKELTATDHVTVFYRNKIIYNGQNNPETISENIDLYRTILFEQLLAKILVIAQSIFLIILCIFGYKIIKTKSAISVFSNIIVFV